MLRHGQNTNFHMPRNPKAAPYFLNTNKFTQINSKPSIVCDAE